jgi:glyoxylase-like metal-dependent hydrolase (beta-lactamase superfamily II)
MPSHSLGDFELSVFSDGTYFLDGGALFGVVPKPMWERRRSPDEKNRLAVGLNSLLIRTGSKTVLVETGIGNKLTEKMVKIYAPQARLLENLNAAGIAPEDVDIVINTHLHFDHCGWNTVERGGQIVATFPRAQYYVQAGEYEHGCRQLERDRMSYLDENYGPLIRSGQMTLLRGDAEIVPGIRVRVLPGHTAHMQAVMIESGGRKACYISDLVPTTAHLEPTWVMAFDLFPLETIENRKRIYAEAIPGKWLMVFTHDHEHPWGWIEKAADGKLAVRPV